MRGGAEGGDCAGECRSPAAAAPISANAGECDATAHTFRSRGRPHCLRAGAHRRTIHLQDECGKLPQWSGSTIVSYSLHGKHYAAIIVVCTVATTL
eukprot:185550-Chlamydomonas_euryale.AAC.1